jgi:hypothetical protein
MPENTKERLKDALKRYKTGIILRMLRDAGHLERRGEGRKNGDGTVTGNIYMHYHVNLKFDPIL